MATAVIMPRQGQSVETCIITKWHKNKGDYVNKGDLLFSYETDKAAFDEEAEVSGTILEIFFKEDDEVPVLSTVCVIGEEGEDTSEFFPDNKKKKLKDESASIPVETSAGKTSEGTAVIGRTGTGEQETEASNQGFSISPRARSLADKIGVDYSGIAGSGPHGRIIERDVRRLWQEGRTITPAARDIQDDKAVPVATNVGTGLGGRITVSDITSPASGTISGKPGETGAYEEEYTVLKLTNIRKAIARSMHQSLSESAQLTLHSSFNATEILDYRKKVKEAGQDTGIENITLNDIILYAVSRVLPSYKELNAHYMGDSLHVYKNVHMGFAVDTERGLMVPTLFNCNLKSLNQISKEARELIEQCRKGSVNPDLLRGGTFTVTNLGSLGIESFTPIINPPQTGILGVNNIIQRAIDIDGQVLYYPAMGLSLTFDHRALDGALAARFLKDLREALENFTLLLAKG